MKWGVASKMISFGAFLLLVFGTIIWFRNKNFDQFILEANKEITLLESVSAEEARQLSLQKLRKKRQYYQKQKMW
jgi:hypothetical protein